MSQRPPDRVPVCYYCYSSRSTKMFMIMRSKREDVFSPPKLPVSAMGQKIYEELAEERLISDDRAATQACLMTDSCL